MAPPSVTPETFARAVEGLRAGRPRPEITLTEMAAPQRLAPYAHALSASVDRDGDEVVSGRLILLYDPAGHEAWGGVLRLVTYVTADLDPELVTDALATHDVRYTALGGTVTQTLSTRFGELSGPEPNADIEIRASWTPLQPVLHPHLDAWCTLLSTTAGLPPPGVSLLAERRLGRNN